MMKLNVTEPTTVEAAFIRCALSVNYEEEDIPNDYPHRKGEMWDITIDIETGQILDWPAGVQPRDVYMKVVDGGSYYLLDPQKRVLAELENEYVPDAVPGEYGDYVDFKIDEGGKIKNWSADEDTIKESFFKDDDE